jgi:hypothetical protein
MIGKTDTQKVKDLKNKLSAFLDTVGKRISEWDEKEFILAYPIGTQVVHPEKEEYFSLIDEAESILLTTTTMTDKDKSFYQQWIDELKKSWDFYYCRPNMCRLTIVTKNVNYITSQKEANEIIDRLVKILRDNREPPNSRVATVMDQSEFSSIVDEIRTIDHMFHG